MIRTKRFRTLLTLIMLLSTLALLAAPFSPQVSPALAKADQDLVRLKINNRDAKMVTLRLYGEDTVYNLRVAGKTSSTFTVQRGSYSYILTGCGLVSKGEMDILKNTIMVNPVCGGNIKSASAPKIDLSEELKLVKVYITNKVGATVSVILTGPSTHVITLKDDQTGTYTLAKKTYNVRYFACGGWVTRQFDAYKNATLVLKCPSR